MNSHEETDEIIDLLQGIWLDAVEHVDGHLAVQSSIEIDVTACSLRIEEREYSLSQNSRIIVIGAGKACAHMAVGIEQVLSETPWFNNLIGWVNVPATTIETYQQEIQVDQLIAELRYKAVGNDYVPQKIRLHPARPGGSNFPTAAGIVGTEKMLKLLESMTDDDLAIVLISGGGSALLPAPIPEISLEQKLWITKHLSQSGATIQELNTVRICLSQVKGGKLLQHIPHGQAVSLIISDIVGDPVDLIASGPTVPTSVTPALALNVLKKYPHNHETYKLLYHILQRQIEQPAVQTNHQYREFTSCDNYIIASNTIALNFARLNGNVRYKFSECLFEADPFIGDARAHAKVVAEKLRSARNTVTKGVDILYLAGGETTVNLADTPHPGKGGRNQEVVLAVLCEFWETGMEGIYFLSGGTDGEDGPTDAAGAFIHQGIWKKAIELNLDPHDYLTRHDAYHFFEQLDALLITGPTHTNVMDIEVGIVTS